ncbi:MAG: uracil-DNA glycosylase [Bacteroidia bacterium]|nr:uracil-DNA glycosylase [Bacteroidia bacterium]
MVEKQADPKIESSWKDLLQEEFRRPSFLKLREFLNAEKKQFPVYPPSSLIFNAFNRTPVDRVKVVIIGQDPYHGAGQAHGLSFSVPDGVKCPPSLVNIFKELKRDLGLEIPFSGNLEKWADRGVLLLNATLTVRAGVAGSHQKKGWEEFTDNVIRNLSEQGKGIVFLLWGNFAKQKISLINTDRHFILTAAHPSPLAGGAFAGCGHFSEANRLLESAGKEPVNWDLNP